MQECASAQRELDRLHPTLAPADHDQTAHYAAWRDAIADMMASPRSSVKFESLYPEEARWSTLPA